MTRPPSIVAFERCYLGSVAVGLANTALTWNDRLALPAVRRAAAMAPGSFVPLMVAGVVGGAAISLLLWFLAARRGWLPAKWIVVAFFALAVLGLLLSLAQGSFVSGLGGALTALSTLLQAAAAWMLFRPDARAWFGEDGEAA
jgi:hypothetical protein